jgi:hypothetical protein
MNIPLWAILVTIIFLQLCYLVHQKIKRDELDEEIYRKAYWNEIFSKLLHDDEEQE